jgi:hypothetical protein
MMQCYGLGAHLFMDACHVECMSVDNEGAQFLGIFFSSIVVGRSSVALRESIAVHCDFFRPGSSLFGSLAMFALIVLI